MSRELDAASLVAQLPEAIEALDGAVEDEERDLFAAFCREVLPQMRPPYLQFHGPARILEVLLSLFRFCRLRPPGRILAEVEHVGGERIVVRSNMPDQPFIVDTVRLLVQSYGAAYEAGLNAIVPMRRDPEGRLVEVGGDDAVVESLVQVHAIGLDREEARAAGRMLRRNLEVARVVVADFEEMVDGVERLRARFEREARRVPDQADDLSEAAEFLKWLLTDNFVFMGLRMGDERLGIERDPELAVPEDTDVAWPAPWGAFPVRIRKSSLESPIHRSGRIDEIRVEVPGFARRGSVLIRGLFTYRAVTQPKRTIPILRRVLVQLLRRENAPRGSWRYKGVANAFDSLPTEFLFTGSVEEIARIVDRVLEAEAEQRVGVQAVRRADGQTTFVLAAMPRTQFSDAVRRRMQKALRQITGATYADSGVFVGRYDTVLVHFFLTGGRRLDEEDLGRIRQELTELATPWSARLHRALTGRFGEAEAARLTAIYGHAFGETYTAHTHVDQAVQDILIMEELGEENRVRAAMMVDRKGRTHVRLYQAGDLLLSDILPVLDAFGLIVIDQYAETIERRGKPRCYLDSFRLQGAWNLDPSDILERGPKLTRGLEAVFHGWVAPDTLNRLLLLADLTWQEVDLVRAYAGYLNQLGLPVSLRRIHDILLGHPDLVATIVAAFHALFDPDLVGDREAAAEQARAEVEDRLAAITLRDDDLVLRGLWELVDGTVRTNFYRTDRRGHYISFKIEHARVSRLPEPRMLAEIYVHHVDMEGVHIRGARTARGGIRWSDRDDFRAEILGLVSTQMVKNVLIVPEGAKGGFRMKRQVRNVAERRARADTLYTFLIRGMLDLTDNIVDGEIVRPPRVVVRDVDDPYLVVAADKGTAHLSDTANRLAEEYGFWLGDAFASGGSNGYDHKRVGITARGAWVCVRRHLLEMGIDPRREPFTAIGIGDPSGDVFGNGVLEYPTMRLLAAFNHRHIFLDPDPDPEASYAERRRLFQSELDWSAYNRDLLSEGGMIVPRNVRSVRLTEQVRRMLGVLAEEMPPDALIRMVLRMPATLLWNGGIGTYVKASHETHRDASDPANDGVRINASELRVRVVGEGGNLGFTQAARIEYALHGGRINTDAVDNSGGVDMSDREVNIKILLARARREGRIDEAERHHLIREVTEEVAEAVLEDNDLQALQLSLDQLRSVREPFLFGRAVAWVAARQGSRSVSRHLPDNAALARRAQEARGLTRPELAELSGFVKLHVFRELQAGGDWRAIPGAEEALVRYFPERFRQRFASEIGQHMLAGGIALTAILTRQFSDAGVTLYPVLQDLTDRPALEIAIAWERARRAFGIDELRQRVARCSASFEGRYQAWLHVVDGVVGMLAVALGPGEPPLDDAQFQATLRVLRYMARHRPAAENEGRLAQAAGLVDRGVPRGLAQTVSRMRELTIAREIALLREEFGDSLRDAVVRYFGIGDASRLLQTIRRIEARRGQGVWDPVAIAILRGRYLRLLRDLVRKVELGQELGLSVERMSYRLHHDRLGALAREVETVLGDAPSVGALLVAEERVRAHVLA